MKNSTLASFFLLSLFLLTGNLFAFNGLDKNGAPVTTDPCEAPPPGWLIATNITPTSISLAWEAGQLSTFYKCDAYDLTGGFALPTQYVFSTPFYTWNGLTPGHTYLFEVRASLCEDGPYSNPASRQETTTTIIIDVVLELNIPCNPGNSLPTGPNVTYSLCVDQSVSQDEPYDHAYVGRLQYDNKNYLYFSLAGVGSKAHFGGVEFDGPVNSDFTFPDNTNHPTWAECHYQGTPIFRVDMLSYNPAPGNGGGTSQLTIKFYDQFQGFSFCNAPNSACAGGGGNGKGIISVPTATPTDRNEAAPSTNADSRSWLSPNPFREQTTFHYEADAAAQVDIALYDALGRLVRVVETTAQKAPGTYEITLEGEGLPDGVYFLKTQIGQQHKVLRLVKQE